MTSQLPFPSSFNHRLGTNYVPTPQEVVQLEEILRGPQETLARLITEISRLESTLQSLYFQRDAMQACIDQHRALLSPFRHLPVDILREIFIQTLPSDHFPTRSLLQAPLLLTTVCKTWREIALTTPHLWTAIHIYIPQLMAECDIDSHLALIQARTEGVKRWLDRSGSLPISFSLVIDARPLFYPSRLTTPHAGGLLGFPGVVRTKRVEKSIELMEILLKYSPRWEGVCVRLPLVLISRFESLFNKRPPPCSLPELRSLRIAYSLPDNAFGDDPHDGRTHMLSSVLQAAPSLRSLHLINDLHHDPLHLPLVWTNLTELVLHLANGIFPSQAVDILACTSQMLRKCSMIINVPESDGVIRSAFCGELPRLHVLQLTFMTLWRHQPAADAVSEELRGVFDHIHATSLTHLSITASQVPERLPQVPFLKLLERSSCQLKALEIQFPVSDTALEQCLRLPACSSLSCLVVKEVQTRPVRSAYNSVPTISESLLTALTSNSTTNSLDLCPLLERVVFKNCTCTSRNVRRLIDFIATRSKRGDESNAGARQLKFVAVSFAYDIGDEYLPEIEALEREGVQICWRYERRRKAGDSPEEGLIVPATLDVDKEWL
ncbi:hypothetical protein E1B28_005199 [Marasmius oreades]|uniref:F-box domain-containing protein n=1 Tax=Marasmius oreades TaxID=181124 RepID=A0A9P8ADK4_9AGAR|nr:uncharacterized protein E1B28_005199 [Marasmius oreades]KAG7097886.1 hypothetical protein E1B28_005199 [Marasmius oreades]